MDYTAKVKVSLKAPAFGENTNVHFIADYDYQNPELNKDWAAATPYMSIQMVVKNSLAEHIELDDKYTLTFHKDA